MIILAKLLPVVVILFLVYFYLPKLVLWFEKHFWDFRGTFKNIKKYKDKNKKD